MEQESIVNGNSNSLPLVQGVRGFPILLETTYVYTPCWRMNYRSKYFLASTPRNSERVIFIFRKWRDPLSLASVEEYKHWPPIVRRRFTFRVQ